MESPKLAEWCLIESDPGVFYELAHEFGVSGVQFEDIYSLDLLNDQTSWDADILPPVSLTKYEPPIQKRRVYGLIFLFSCGVSDSHNGGLDDPSLCQFLFPKDIFFAAQVVPNACATNAILSILMNSIVDGGMLNLGSHLTELKDFTKDFDPFMKGLAISNSEVLRNAHNAFRPSDAFFDLGQEWKDNDEENNACHFVGYVQCGNDCYEMDGLKPGPRLVGQVARTQDWYEVAADDIEKRIERMQTKSGGNEIRFSLIAVVDDLYLKVVELLEFYRSLIEQVRLRPCVERNSSFSEIPSIELPHDTNSLQELEDALASHIKTLETVESRESATREVENHSFVSQIRIRCYRFGERRTPVVVSTSSHLCCAQCGMDTTTCQKYMKVMHFLISHLGKRGALKEAYLAAKACTQNSPKC